MHGPIAVSHITGRRFLSAREIKGEIGANQRVYSTAVYLIGGLARRFFWDHFDYAPTADAHHFPGGVIVRCSSARGRWKLAHVRRGRPPQFLHRPIPSRKS